MLSLEQILCLTSTNPQKLDHFCWLILGQVAIICQNKSHVDTSQSEFGDEIWDNLHWAVSSVVKQR